jgi:AcrR family transcriptional regulator
MDIGKLCPVPKQVKPRGYDSSRRQATAAETRSRILAAARQLFIADGYSVTTIAAIARHAEVAADTVHASVGTKPALLRELIETALSGTDRAVEGAQREYALRMRDEPHAPTKLAIYAAAVTELQCRLAPLFLVLREASASHADLAELWKEITERRARNMRLLADDLISTGRTRADLARDDIADIIWTMNSSEYYAMLVFDRGWTPARFQDWLCGAWTRLLLD